MFQYKSQMRSADSRIFQVKGQNVKKMFCKRTSKSQYLISNSNFYNNIYCIIVMICVEIFSLGISESTVDRTLHSEMLHPKEDSKF